MIRLLKKIGMGVNTLVPILEYSINAFHTILTAEQSGALKRLQRITLKLIFGFKSSYASCLKESGLEDWITDENQCLASLQRNLTSQNA